MIRLMLIAVVFWLGAADAQIRFDQQVKVADSDPGMAALNEWQQSVEAAHRKGGDTVATFAPWFVLTSEALKESFPDFRFYLASWSLGTAPGKDGSLISLPSGLGVTLVCDTEGKLVKVVHHTGNYEAFGELLNAAKVAIRTSEDAKLVWDSFCDVHQMHWQKLPTKKVDDRTWHLGNSRTERSHYYYEAVLGADFRVLRAKLQSGDLSEP